MGAISRNAAKRSMTAATFGYRRAPPSIAAVTAPRFASFHLAKESVDGSISDSASGAKQ